MSPMAPPRESGVMVKKGTAELMVFTSPVKSPVEIWLKELKPVNSSKINPTIPYFGFFKFSDIMKSVFRCTNITEKNIIYCN